jgi:hypothetical protein
MGVSAPRRPVAAGERYDTTARLRLPSEICVRPRPGVTELEALRELQEISLFFKVAPPIHEWWVVKGEPILLQRWLPQLLYHLEPRQAPTIDGNPFGSGIPPKEQIWDGSSWQRIRKV